MRTNTVTKPQGEVIQFPVALQEIFYEPEIKPARTNSPLKSNGQPKATPADPIRSEEDLHKMQQYFLDKKQYRNYLLLTLGVSFALRAGDLLSLDITDVYNDDGTVRDELCLYEDKTNKRNRIKINATCKAALEKYFEMLPEPIYRRDPLFRSRETDGLGQPRAITIKQLDNILKKAAKECGITYHISTHSLRKTFAYLLITKYKGDQEVLYALQYMLNHSDIRTTFRYTGIQNDVASKLREDVGGMLL